MDPLNFFQLFSVALWFFDDNFYHPLLMLFLLLITNFTVCVQRISTILNLRSLQTKAYYVKRKEKNGSFSKVSSEELKPGDIIVLRRSNELKEFIDKNKKPLDVLEEIKHIIPLGDKLPPHLLMKFLPKEKDQHKIVNSSDVLVIDGSIAADESILTGENLP